MHLARKFAASVEMSVQPLPFTMRVRLEVGFTAVGATYDPRSVWPVFDHGSSG
jgi:hypothetical protein